MRIICHFLAAAAASLLVPSQAAVAQGQPSDESIAWRDVATQHDRERLREWRSAWMEGLRRARAAGHAADIAREGALLEPDAALLRPEPQPGLYRCRTIKVGGRAGLLDYIAYPEFRCRIRSEGGVLSFAKISGSQRPMGRLYADGPRRMIFLGTLQLGDERQVLRYGMDRDRDTPGILERIGEDRWRLVFPRPAFESIIDVIELAPLR
jgi:hypothetical protein